MAKTKRSSAPRTSPRPRARPIDLTPNAERPSADDLEFMLRRRQGAQTRRPVEEGDEGRERKMAKGGKAKAKKMSYGGKAKVKKMKDGGMCRGMGAATRGGNYKMG